VRFRTFAPKDIRLRGYVSGEALARILDRLDPGWKLKIAGSLDELLPAADASGCVFPATERAAALEQARLDVATLERERVELMKGFEAQPGWRIAVETASGKPLTLGAFDPINVTRLTGQMILHKRWLRLKNDAGSLEILNHGSITEAAGAHPLFNGVRRWTTTGLGERPELQQDGSRVTLAGPAVRLDFSNAEVEWGAQSAIIRLR
jgi:hypothetical protein